MLLLDLKLAVVAAVLAGPIAYSALAPSASVMPGPEMVTLAAGHVTFRPAGDFARAGKPIAAPVKTVRFAYGLTIMKHQVTQVEYRRCIDDGACPAIALDPQEGMPVVGVSWWDANAYAEWLSRKSGERYRLPTDDEWAFAAGSRFHDEGWPDGESSDPARRWLARYEQESARDSVSRSPQSIGSFGVNENGLLDVAGNVWEWSDTCFTRVVLDAAGAHISEMPNCGVRVLQGRHRTYATDFIRDARMGGCAVGRPPANLGFRLVSESKSVAVATGVAGGRMPSLY